jgi:hypothetical protein
MPSVQKWPALAGHMQAMSVEMPMEMQAPSASIHLGVELQKKPLCVRALNRVRKSDSDTLGWREGLEKGGGKGLGEGKMG